MEADFGDLIDTVKPLIEKGIPSLQKLKDYLGTLYQGLISQLNEAESFDDVMKIVREKCTIISVVCLQRVVKKFNITEAKQHIEDFKTTVGAFCNKVRLNVCDRRSFQNSSSSLLKCDTIEFVLKWDPDKYSLSHIERLLEKAFEHLAEDVLVNVVKETNSITVTCYAPRNLMIVLLIEAEKNLQTLIKMGLMKLTISYYTVWDEQTIDKVRYE